MRQYINRFSKTGFLMNEEKLLNDYYIYRVNDDSGNPKEFRQKVSKARNEMKKRIRPFGVIPGRDKTEYIFIAKEIIADDSLTLHRISLIEFQRLPLYIKGNIILTIIGFDYSDYVSDLMFTVPVRLLDGEIFCQRFVFKKENDKNAVLCMQGKTLTKKTAFSDKELEYLKEKNIQMATYTVQDGIAYENGDDGEYYGRKLDRRRSIKNSLKYAFSLEHIKSEEDIHNQTLPLFIHVYQMIKECPYIEKLEPDHIEVNRMEEGIIQYKELLKHFYERISGDEFTVVVGDSVITPDIEHDLISKLNECGIPEAAVHPKFHASNTPSSMTIYIIEENGSGRTNAEKMENPSESDIDYNKTRGNTDNAVIQHVAYNTLVETDKNGRVAVNVPVLLNILMQLYIKKDAKEGRSTLMPIKGDYRFYLPHPTLDENEDEKMSVDIIEYHNNRFTWACGVPLNQYSYPMDKDKSIQYIIVKMNDEDPELWPQVTVSDSEIFAIPKPDTFTELISDKTKLNSTLAAIDDLWNILNDTFEEVPDNESYDRFSNILEDRTDTMISLGRLKGKNTKFKKALDRRIYEAYGVHLSFSAKSKNYIDENYPSFAQITYSSEGIFVPSFQNPTQGLNNLSSVIRMKKTEFELEDFMDELIHMLYNPFGKYKQLSYKPLPIKLLKEAMS